ncbi:hypothetical protein SLS56_003943 [Neofusicoccum ribis]|uniref:Uncharacterized protein n=1 Tax=Neofusicoccum ribis TaxID=45134 RepID=A0ABR3SY11_9PEZI
MRQIICLVVAEAADTRDTLKQLRLCCRWLAEEAAKYLFVTVSVQLQKKSMEKLIEFSMDKPLASHVNTLLFTGPSTLAELNFEDWKNGDVHLAEYHISTIFQADLKAENELAAGNMVAWIQTVVKFEGALLRFHNLQRVEHIRTKNHHKLLHWWQTQARGVYPGPALGFNLLGAIEHEAAYTALMFRTLGWCNSHGSTFTSLKLELAEDSRLSRQGFDKISRYLDMLYYNADNRLSTRLTRQSNLILNAFTHLKDLYLHMTVEPSLVPYTCEVLAGWLSQARKLERLDLAIPTQFDRPDRFGADTLAWLALGVPDNNAGSRVQWPELKDLKLNISLSENSLLSVLSQHTGTLEHICLSSCEVSGGSDAWPGICRNIREAPFTRLSYLAVPGSDVFLSPAARSPTELSFFKTQGMRGGTE